jgi:hypothetical protein
MAAFIRKLRPVSPFPGQLFVNQLLKELLIWCSIHMQEPGNNGRTKALIAQLKDNGHENLTDRYYSLLYY